MRNIVKIQLVVMAIAWANFCFAGNQTLIPFPKEAKKSSKPFRIFDSRIMQSVDVYYLKGKLIGNVFYYKNDQIYCIEPISLNKAHGEKHFFHPNGKIKSIHPHKNGLLHGAFKQFSRTGELINQFEMKNGSGIFWVWHNNKKVKTISTYKNNLKNGITYHYHVNGKLSRTEIYEDDQMTGESFRYNIDGSLRRWTHYREGMEYGPLFIFEKSEIKKEYYCIGADQFTKNEYSEKLKTNPELPGILSIAEVKLLAENARKKANKATRNILDQKK